MTLNRRRPPGRLNRKALEFASDIGRLHALGYSSEAIRQALIDAGLVVSRSTILREVSKQSKRRPAGPNVTEGLTPSVEKPPVSEPKPTAMSAIASDPRSGRDIAKAWAADRNPNPLFRARTANESSRH